MIIQTPPVEADHIVKMVNNEVQIEMTTMKKIKNCLNFVWIKIVIFILSVGIGIIIIIWWIPIHLKFGFKDKKGV